MKKTLTRIFAILFSVCCLASCDSFFHRHIDDNADTICDTCGHEGMPNVLGIAPIVLEREEAMRAETATLNAENPSFIYYANLVDHVDCIFVLESTVSVEDVIEQYDMRNKYEEASISAWDNIHIIWLTFDRNDFTENVYQEIKQIGEDARVKEKSIDLITRYVQSYMPKIESYIDNAEKLEYEPTKNSSITNSGKGFIIKSLEEYNAYLEYLLEVATHNIDEEIEFYRTAYNAEFFQENALIITKVINRPSGSILLTVDGLYIDGNKAYVVVRTDEPGGGTGDFQCTTFTFTVKQSDVANVDEVITLE